jgi:hypothetical protein
VQILFCEEKAADRENLAGRNSREPEILYRGEPERHHELVRLEYTGALGRHE